MTRQRIFSGSKYEDMAGYARAVIAGDMIFVSGTVGYDFETGALPKGAGPQAEQAFRTIANALAEVDAALADVVRVVAYVPDPADVPAVAAACKTHLGAHPPANTTVCAPLAVPECAVEIEVTAIRRH
jgi:enamine deaminase RidA (YjgF/YER057c/UK114 family)